MKRLLLFITLILTGLLAESQVSNVTGFYLRAINSVIIKGDTIKYFHTVTPDDTVVSKSYVDKIRHDLDSLTLLQEGHDPLTIDSIGAVNGLNLTGLQVLNIKHADSLQSGALLNSDWVDFNNKLTTVAIDSTLTGSGTITDPLKINPNALAGTLKTTYELTLAASGTIDGRINATVEGVGYPTGWVLSSGVSPADINIVHNTNRRVASVNVFYQVTGTEFRQLVNFNNAYTGILTPNNNSLRIEGLTTIQKEIKIYITFTQ